MLRKFFMAAAVALAAASPAVGIPPVMPVPPAQFAMVEQSMNMLRPTLLQMFSTDPNTREIFAKASERGVGLSLVIICKDDRQKSFAIVYEASELADALK